VFIGLIYSVLITFLLCFIPILLVCLLFKYKENLCLGIHMFSVMLLHQKVLILKFIIVTVITSFKKFQVIVLVCNWGGKEGCIEDFSAYPQWCVLPIFFYEI
jgi:hypothetical protein